MPKILTTSFNISDTRHTYPIVPVFGMEQNICKELPVLNIVAALGKAHHILNLK